MKIHRGLKKIALLAVIVGGALLRPVYAQNDAGVPKILILPPAIQAVQEMAFLRAGVVDMLASRLAHGGKLEVLRVDKAQTALPSDDAAAVALARLSGADYVLLESLTMLGDSVSTDARMLETVNGKVVLNFGKAGKTQGDVIAHIDELAARINTRLFGRPGSPAIDPPAVAAPPKTDSSDQADIHQHPEKLLPPLSRDQREFAGFDAGSGPAVKTKLLMRTARIDRQIRGVTAGDVDGDGRPELICVDAMAVLVYREDRGRLVKWIERRAGAGNVGVDSADLNRNGLDEIFVTHFDAVNERVYSYVLEWDGKQLQRIADGMRWYFRSVDLAERGRVLVGQRQGLDERFSGSVYEIGFSAGTYEGVQKLNLRRGGNVYGFAQGTVRTSDQNDSVDFSPGGNLRLLDRRGNEEWSSVDDYGGTPIALTIKSKDAPEEKSYFFLPSRLHLLDLEDDGIQEVVTVKNDNRAGVLSHTRSFKSGQLQILQWDQLGFAPIWRSSSISKYIGDFTTVDMDGDGRPELVAAVVQKTRNVLGKGRSYLAVFKLAAAPEKEQ